MCSCYGAQQHVPALEPHRQCIVGALPSSLQEKGSRHKGASSCVAVEQSSRHIRTHHVHMMCMGWPDGLHTGACCVEAPQAIRPHRNIKPLAPTRCAYKRCSPVPPPALAHLLAADGRGGGRGVAGGPVGDGCDLALLQALLQGGVDGIQDRLGGGAGQILPGAVLGVLQVVVVAPVDGQVGAGEVGLQGGGEDTSRGEARSWQLAHAVHAWCDTRHAEGFVGCPSA